MRNLNARGMRTLTGQSGTSLAQARRLIFFATILRISAREGAAHRENT